MSTAMVASVSGASCTSSQQKQQQKLCGSRHQAGSSSKEPETPAQGSVTRTQTPPKAKAPSAEPPEEQEDSDDDDDLDEEAELRQCALEAKTASTRKDAIEDRAEGAAIEDEKDDTIVILDSSDDEDGAAAAAVTVPALSPADRFQRALALLRQNVTIETSDETTKEALRETAQDNTGKPVADWAEAAIIWLTLQDDNKQEIHDMALAMAVSLAEKRPLKEESDERIKEIFRRSAVLREVESWMSHVLLRDTIVDFLDLEGKCKKWWTGVDGYFEEAAMEFRGLLQQQKEEEEEEEGLREASGSGVAGERRAEADGQAGAHESPGGKKRRRRSGGKLPAAKRTGSKAVKGPAQASPGAKEGMAVGGSTPETPASSSAKAAPCPTSAASLAETPTLCPQPSNQLNEGVAQRLLGMIAAKMDEIKSDPSFLKPETTGPPAVFQPFWQREQGVIELDHD